MTERKNNHENEGEQTPQPVHESKKRQEQSDPQLTELRGFTDSSEDLEPTLTDGTKAPDKAEEENKTNS